MWISDNCSSLLLFSHTSVSANDGDWHHICITWENIAGSWQLFKDGRIAASGRGLAKGHWIRGGGLLLLGQEQDSLGGSFDAQQSFIGELTGVNVWGHVLRGDEITRMSRVCLTGDGDIIQWRSFKANVRGSVHSIDPSCWSSKSKGDEKYTGETSVAIRIKNNSNVYITQLAN